MDNVAAAISKCGRGALLGKIDIQSAFRIIPVHPEDRRLLGMLWKDLVYIDTTLPFGLRSAPKLFNSLADALQWIMKKKEVHWVAHYLMILSSFGHLHPQSVAKTCKQLY